MAAMRTGLQLTMSPRKDLRWHRQWLPRPVVNNALAELSDQTYEPQPIVGLSGPCDHPMDSFKNSRACDSLMLA